MIKYIITSKKNNLKIFEIVFYDFKVAKSMIKTLKRSKFINIIEVKNA